MPFSVIECVPNVSEGRDGARIDRLARVVAAVPGVTLLHRDPGAGANRTVFTFVGEPEAVGDAAFRLARAAVAEIDLRRHAGKHPRIGALDVCPFVPLRGTLMETCRGLARSVGARIGAELEVPVFLYAQAATVEARQDLARVRRGQFEGLGPKLQRPEWKPDFGPSVPHPTAGAFAVGARAILLAFNVTLESRDETLATEIATHVRATGGGFPFVKAIGWTIEEYDRVQVSMNLLEPETTPPHVVFDAIRALAAERGVGIYGSEVIGLAPLAALVEAGRHHWSQQAPDEPPPEQASLVVLGMDHLQLDRPLHRFDPHERVLEWRLPD
jgi:glutamate formiminotransferase